MGTEYVGSKSCRHYQYSHAHAQQYSRAATTSLAATPPHYSAISDLTRVSEQLHCLPDGKQLHIFTVAAEPQLLHWRQRRLFIQPSTTLLA